MKVDNYKDKTLIRFDESGDVHKAITNLPHYKTWAKLLKHLKNRGFKIETPIYCIEQNYGKHTHKTAYRENVVITLELMSSQIKVEYGDIKNLWKDWGFHFWSLTDSRSVALTYLESKKIQLEVNKLLSLFPAEKTVNHDVKLTDVERIIKNKKESGHTIDISKLDELGLDGIVYQMSEYDFSQNSKDRDKKQINCGELKYFYGYDKILRCGKVYHNLNNMWWVLTSDGYSCKASHELFDLNGESRRKKLTTEQKINRLESELKKYESKKNYIRCISVNKQIEKLKNSEKVYNVWSLKHNSWWGANNNGYVSDKRDAGVYLESNILENQSYYNNGVSTKAIMI